MKPISKPWRIPRALLPMLAALCGLSGPPASAADRMSGTDFAVDDFVLSGGGSPVDSANATREGALFASFDTLGQPAIGIVRGTSFAVEEGWIYRFFDALPDLSITDLTAAPATVAAAQAVTFTVSVTGGAPIVSALWDFGDGERFLTDSVTDVQHVYAVPGTYTVTLTVTDILERTDTRTVTVTVLDPNPAFTVSISAAPLSGAAPLTVSFTGSFSGLKNGAQPSYEWDFGDGDISQPAPNALTAEHTYTMAGTYTARFRVYDGDLAKEATVEIAVGNPADLPPALTAGPTATPTPTGTFVPVAFATTGTTGAAATGTVLRYMWDFDGDGRFDAYRDGVSSVQDIQKAIYDIGGSYTARVRITDFQADGRPRLSAEGTVGVTVRPVTGIRIGIRQPREGDTLSGQQASAIIVAQPNSSVLPATAKLGYRLQGAAAFTEATLRSSNAHGKSPKRVWDIRGVAAGTYELRASIEDTAGNTLYSDGAGQQGVVTVTLNPSAKAVPAGTALSRTAGVLPGEDVAESTDAAGRVRRDVAMTRGTGTVSMISRAMADAQVSIPAGGIDRDQATLMIQELSANPTPAATGLFDISYIEVGLSGGAVLTGAADIEFAFSDDDGNGVVDGTAVRTDGLQILHFNAAQGAWETLPGQTHDTENRRVSGRTLTLSPFVLSGSGISSRNGGGGGGICFLVSTPQAGGGLVVILLSVAGACLRRGRRRR